MAITWNDVLTEFQAIIEDPDWQAGGAKEGYLLSIGNDVALEICRSPLINIDRHLKNSTITTTTSDYKFDMPSDFLKPSKNMFFYVSTYDEPIPAIPLDELDNLDPDHSETSTGNQPDYISVIHSKVAIYPKWAGTIQIRNYYRIPAAMTGTSSAVDIITDGVAGDRLLQRIMVNGLMERVYSIWMKEFGLAGKIGEINTGLMMKLASYMKGGATETPYMTPCY